MLYLIKKDSGCCRPITIRQCRCCTKWEKKGGGTIRQIQDHFASRSAINVNCREKKRKEKGGVFLITKFTCFCLFVCVCHSVQCTLTRQFKGTDRNKILRTYTCSTAAPIQDLKIYREGGAAGFLKY